jgi:hypothetical protein
MPIILATWEAEIRNTRFQDQPGQKLRRPYINGKTLGMIANACHLYDLGKFKIEVLWPKPVWGKC